MKNSFEGNRNPKVDDNVYLLEERQAQLNEQVTTHPIVLINKKPYPVDMAVVKKRIC